MFVFIYISLPRRRRRRRRRWWWRWRWTASCPPPPGPRSLTTEFGNFYVGRGQDESHQPDITCFVDWLLSPAASYGPETRKTLRDVRNNYILFRNLMDNAVQLRKLQM